MKEIIIAIGVTLGLVSLFAWGSMTFYSEHALKVTAVGGCDKYGECGAVLEGGRSARCQFPVVGATAYCHIFNQGD